MNTFFLLLLILNLYACAEDPVVKTYKSYELKINADTPEEKELANFIISQIDIFNERTGFKALKIVESSMQGTSIIDFYSKDDPPPEHEEAIGICGHRVTDMNFKSKFAFTKGFVKEITRKTYMECSFQIEYFRARLPLLKDPTSSAYFEAQRTVWHEFGHGLSFDHNGRSLSDVMHEYIISNQNADLEKFFDDVRREFSKGN